jgi:hypothetical protein
MRSILASRSHLAALALEKEKAEKYALVQEALADAVSHTLLVPNSHAPAVADEASQDAAVEVLRQHWRSLQQAATVVGSLAWDLNPFCAAPPVWQSEITIALRVSIRRLCGATNDTQAKLRQGSAAAGVSLVGSPRGETDDGRPVSGVTVRDLCSQSQACVRVTHRELGRIENLLKELHRLLVLLANGLPCPGLDEQVKIEKPQDVAVVPLELEGKAQSHRERVTDNVPTSIPLEYNGHYTVLGKVDVTVGLEPNTKIVGYFFFGTLEVIGSAQSMLCPQLKRLQTSKGWVTWRPTLLQKLEASTSWAESEPEPEPPAAATKAADGGDGEASDGGSAAAVGSVGAGLGDLGLADGIESETQENAEAVLQAELDREEEALIKSEMDGLASDVVYNPAFLPTPDSSAARLHESGEPTYGVTVQGRSSELLLQMCETRLIVIDPVAESQDDDPELFAEIDYADIRNWQYDRRADVLSIEVADARSLDARELGVVHRFGTSDGGEIVRLLEDRKGVPQSPAPVPLPQEYIDRMIPRPSSSSNGGGGISRIASPIPLGVDVGADRDGRASRASESSIGSYSDNGDQLLSPVSIMSGEQLSLPSTIDDFDDQIEAVVGNGIPANADAAEDADLVDGLPAMQQQRRPMRSETQGQAAPKTLAAPEMVQQLEAAAALALAEPGLGETGDCDSLTSLRLSVPSAAAKQAGASHSHSANATQQQQQQPVQGILRSGAATRSGRAAAAAPATSTSQHQLHSEAPLVPSGVSATGTGTGAAGAAGSVHHEMVVVVVRMMDRVQATRKSLHAHI